MSVDFSASTMIGVNHSARTQGRMIFCMLIISSHVLRTGVYSKLYLSYGVFFANLVSWIGFWMPYNLDQLSNISDI